MQNAAAPANMHGPLPKATATTRQRRTQGLRLPTLPHQKCPRCRTPVVPPAHTGACLPAAEDREGARPSRPRGHCLCTPQHHSSSKKTSCAWHHRAALESRVCAPHCQTSPDPPEPPTPKSARALPQPRAAAATRSPCRALCWPSAPRCCAAPSLMRHPGRSPPTCPGPGCGTWPPGCPRAVSTRTRTHQSAGPHGHGGAQVACTGRGPAGGAGPGTPAPPRWLSKRANKLARQAEVQRGLLLGAGCSVLVVCTRAQAHGIRGKVEGQAEVGPYA